MKKNIFILSLLSVGSHSIALPVDEKLSLGGSVGLADANFSVVEDTDTEAYLDLFTSYKFDNGLLLHLSAADFGNHESDDSFDSEVEAQGLSWQVGYSYTVNDLVELYARGGIFFWSAEAYKLQAKASGSGTLPTDISVSKVKVYDDDGTDYTLGLGVDFNISRHFKLGGMVQYYAFDDDSINTFAVAAAYRF